jgi:adenylate cyclase
MDAPRQSRDDDPLDDAAPSIAEVRRTFRRMPFARAATTVIMLTLALLLARYSWELPLGRDAERMFFDVRSLYASLNQPVAQDERILMVPFTPATQEATGKRSPLDRAILAKALRSLDGMGAKAIGIDILIGQPQPEDAELLAALKAMKTPTWLAYASAAHNGDDVQPWEQAHLDSLLRELRGSNVRPASIRIEADGDNAMRSWPTLPKGLPPFLPLALAGKPDAPAYKGSIRYRMPVDLERPVFLSLPIDLFAVPEAAAALAGQVRGRIVLIGGDLPDADRFTTPESRLAEPSTDFGRQWRETVSGLEVHATMLAQKLDGHLPGPTGWFGLWLLALLVVLCGAFTAMLDVKPWVLAVVLIGQIAFFIATPFWLELIGVDTRDLPAFGWLLGWLLGFFGTEATVRAMSSEQRHFAQSALGKYLPRDIAAQILREPEKLSLTGEKRPIFALFTDLEGFTKLSHSMPPDQIAALLNAYLDGMCDIVLKHGGTIDKFVGDALVAIWGAPIARPDDGERIGQALLEMIGFARAFSEPDGDVPKLGRTRVGVHHGEAIVGNFGGRQRFQYTALGDVMNCAARLESANKTLRTCGLVSADAMRLTGLDVFRPMGRIVLSGRATPIEVWEPAPTMVALDRDALKAAWTAYDEGDEEALKTIKALTLAYPEDAALKLLVYRLAESGPRGHFVLGEK